MKALIDKVRSRIFAGLARREDLHHLYDQIAALQQIENAMAGRPMLRPMGGWAISPDAMALMLYDLNQRDCPTVIEFGSGQSTIIFAAVLRHRGGRLISVEHDSDYSAEIQRQLRKRGLDDLVSTFNLPLELSMDEPEQGIRSYDLRSLPRQRIDFALVDGPPRAICGSDTRLVPLRWCVSNLSPNGSIFLDDSKRTHEQGCLAALKREFPALSIQELTAEKGLTLIRKTE